MPDIDDGYSDRIAKILQIGIGLGQAIQRAKSSEIPAVFDRYRQRWFAEFPGEPLPRFLAHDEKITT